MIGLDTNVLVRFLTQDDPKQSAKANRVINQELSEKNQGFVSHPVLMELIWVLRFSYDQSKETLIHVIENLLVTKQLQIERADLVYLALQKYVNGQADFSDALIYMLAESAGCEKTLTFDKKSKSIGMELI